VDDPAPSYAEWREARPPTRTRPRTPPPRGADLGVGPGRRARRIATIAALVALTPGLISYVAAMTGTSNSSFGVRTIEWLRSEGGAGLVSTIENWYYSLTAPSKGGPSLKALPLVGGGLVHERVGAFAPRVVRPLIFPALAGEGVWRRTRTGLGKHPPVLVTVYRDEPAYPREIAGLAWIDTRRVSITLNPGVLEPNVTLPRGSSEVPQALRSRLLATFNSGFKLEDDHSGFALHGRTYAPMARGQATFIHYRNGRYDVINWTHGADVGPSVVFARQNLPLIVDHGRPTPNLNDGPQWGVTVSNALLVWRSAIGVDRYGNLIYFAGNYQNLRDVARALIRAGAVRAMELDINSYWTSFITYGGFGGLDPSNLLPDMQRPATRYLTPDDRDFFAVYLR